MVQLIYTLRLWLSAYDRLEGDAHTKYRLYLWSSIAKDTCQPGSGEVLAACLDGRTGYVVMVFVLDGRCNVVCVRGSVRRAEKR